MQRIVVLLLVACIFLAYQSWPLFTEPQRYNDDQNNIYLLATRRNDPTFLAGDYAYGNPNFLKFYTPLYLDALRYLMRMLGGYDAAMLTLHSLMLTIYLLTMFLLLRDVSGNIWVALGVTLFSALARPAIASEVWGAAGMNLVFPRTAFLAIAPLLFWLTFRWLASSTWWQIALLGLLGGLSANLHPPSGMFFVQILGTLIIAFGCASIRELVWKASLVGFMAILGALPTFFPLLQNLGYSNSDQEIPPFDRFALIVHERLLSILPLPPDQVMLPNGPLSYEWQIGLVLAGLVLGLIWVGLATWQKWRPGRYQRLLIIGLLVISLPLAYLVTIFSALDLVLATLAYWIIRLVRQDEDRVDRYALGVLACTAIYAYVGSTVLGWFWQTLEVWSLTSFYGEQPRMSRFVYLPFFIFLARWVVLLLQQSRNRIIGVVVTIGLVAGLIVRHWHFRDPWGSAEWGMGASLLALTLAGIWSCLGWRAIVQNDVSVYGSEQARDLRHLDGRDTVWSDVGVLGISIAAAIYAWLYILGVPQSGWVAAATALGGCLVYFYRKLSLKQWQLIGGLVITMALGWLFAQGKVEMYNEQPLRIQAHKALGLYQYQPPDQKAQDALAMYDWVQANTLPQARFYYNDRQLEFRSHTHRAVTHSWKDLGGAYYTPLLLIEYYERFGRLEGAWETPEKLIACAEAYQADYIVSLSDQPDLPLSLVYKNESYKVYSVEAAPHRDQAICP